MFDSKTTQEVEEDWSKNSNVDVQDTYFSNLPIFSATEELWFVDFATAKSKKMPWQACR